MKTIQTKSAGNKKTNAQVLELNHVFSTIPLNGESIMVAADNIVDLSPRVQAWNIARDALIRKNGKDGVIIKGSKEYLKFEAEENALKGQMVEVSPLKKIKRSDIDKDRKPLAVHIAVLKIHDLLEG